MGYIATGSVVAWDKLQVLILVRGRPPAGAESSGKAVGHARVMLMYLR